jgi:glycosyltransferase involved in cell wall biosynthesis
MGRLSVLVLTLNEERNIAACLDSVRWADEIIVVDSGSTDRTVELARAYTDKVYQIEWKGYGATRNLALGRTSGDWILWLDADERVTPELAAEVRDILGRAELPESGFQIARRAYFLGRWIRHCGWYPGRVTRLFRRERGRFTESSVHERLILDGAVADTRNDLIHLTDPNLSHYFAKFNRYTSLAAHDLRSEGRRFRLRDLLVRPLFAFVKMYVLKRGFLDGMQGFILCVLSSAYVFTKYAKLWELERRGASTEGD